MPESECTSNSVTAKTTANSESLPNLRFTPGQPLTRRSLIEVNPIAKAASESAARKTIKQGSLNCGYVPTAD